MVSSNKALFSRVTSIVISVQESADNTDKSQKLPSTSFTNCKSCLFTCHIPDEVDPLSLAPEKKRFRGCQGQFLKAHTEANEVVKFYKEISRGKCTWLRDPTIEELDKCLNDVIESKSDG